MNNGKYQCDTVVIVKCLKKNDYAKVVNLVII